MCKICPDELGVMAHGYNLITVRPGSCGMLVHYVKVDCCDWFNKKAEQPIAKQKV